MTCSIGIGPNKLIAKIASDIQKPDGLTFGERRGSEKVSSHLFQCENFLWVGHKTEARLKELGINTIGDLAHFDPSVLAGKIRCYGHTNVLDGKGHR